MMKKKKARKILEDKSQHLITDVKANVATRTGRRGCFSPTSSTWWCWSITDNSIGPLEEAIIEAAKDAKMNVSYDQTTKITTIRTTSEMVNFLVALRRTGMYLRGPQNPMRNKKLIGIYGKNI